MVQLQTPPSAYLASLEAFHTGIAARGPAWLHQLRLEAAARFTALGFPTTKLEDWKYTNVAPIAEGAFEPSFGPTAAIPTGPFTFGAAWNHLAFVNGAYAPALSSVSDLPRGMRVESLASALSNGSAPVLERHLARYAPHESDSFVALNTAFLRDGALVHVPDGKIAETPVHLLFITTGGEKRVASYPRVLIVLGRGAAATVVESYVSLGQGPSFTNAVTEIVAGDGAIVQHYKLQFESRTSYFINTTRADLGGDAKLSSFALDLGGKLARSTLTARLQAPGGECTLDGLYLATDQQHIDNHTAIDHAASHTSSSQLYKGILASKARTVFNGKVVVRRGTQAVDAHQVNNNLLLSSEAESDTKPQLEIFTDDVRCTHGATIGQLDEDAIFYFNSRGLSRKAARTLLTFGFASDLLGHGRIQPLRSTLDGLLLAWLQTELEAKATP